MPPEIHGVRWLLAVARSGGHPLYPLLHLITYTGLLRGEALALRWDNVALEGRYIHIVESAGKTHREGVVVGRTKTGKSVRTADLDPTRVDVLTRHRNRQLSIEGSAPALVFPGLAGKVLRHATILKQIKRLGAKAGMPDITFHSL
ncbi:MAG: tyrosine-type recombinase/integrase [Chloroflexi bacterium]|nr:tyrosine-type recombinase/integrase [Chloroflexota bacterium]